MSLHRVMFVALATMFTAGTTSLAFAGCCHWPTPAPVVYGGCGGCGAALAPVTYAAPPVQPVAVTVGCGGCAAPIYNAPVGCGGCGPIAYPPVPLAPAPIYVVNQGPQFDGPGLMVPFRYYTPPVGYGPGAYPYIARRPYPYYRRIAYSGPRWYPRPHYYGPRWRGYPPLPARY